MMADQKLPLDDPPSYTSANPYAAPPATAATTVGIVQRTEVQQRDTQYSCANPTIEVIERIARIVFIVILIIYAGLAIAVMARVNTREARSEYYDDYDEDEENTPYVLAFSIIMILAVSMCCTVGSLLCDIPVMIAHFVTNKVMNNYIFRSLDVGKWIALSILYGMVLLAMIVVIEAFGDYTPGPLIILCLVFCCIIIVMGVTMAVWDCVNLSSARTTTSSSQVVTVVPANSVATTVV